MNTPETNHQDITLPIGMLRPIGLLGLSKMYGVDYKTFKKWLVPFQDKIGVKVGRYFTVNQVRIIAQNLGLPGLPS